MQNASEKMEAELRIKCKELAQLAVKHFTSNNQENLPSNRRKRYQGSDFSFEKKQPNPLLRFLALLLNLRSSRHRDLLNHDDIKTLRLVNVETKDFIDKVAPLVKFKVHVADLPACINSKGMSTKLKTLDVSLSKHTTENATLGVIFTPLLQLESLTVHRVATYGALILQHGPPAWGPALTSLELTDDYHPAKTLHTLAHARVKSLRKLH